MDIEPAQPNSICKTSVRSSHCPYLFHGLMMTPTAEVRPCCRFDTQQYQESFYLPETQSLDDFYRSPLFTQLREAAVRGTPIAGCRRCYEEEAMGVKSMRQKDFPGGPLEASPSSTAIVALEIPSGRTCNLKCRSCNSFFSTKWDQDAQALNMPRPASNRTVDLNNVPLDFFSSVRHLKVTGGEPCLSKPLITFLERLADSEWAPRMELEIFSNATIKPPPPLISSFPRFKRVDLSLSIDALGEQNTYLRHPSSWPVVEDVVALWHQQLVHTPSLKINFAVTISVLNVLSIFDLLSWIARQSPGRLPQTVFQIVHDPAYLNINSLPVPLKQALEKLFSERKKSFLTDSRFQSWGLNFKKIEHLFQSEASRNVTEPKTFWGSLGELDQIRSESADAVFPEVMQLLRTHPAFDVNRL